MTVLSTSAAELRALLEEAVPELLEEFQVPGAGIALRVGDERLGFGFGVTNLEHPLPVDGDTVFQIGSISKTLLGVIVAQLEAEGLVELDAPVAPLLAGLGRLDPRITLAHLITHRSGIDAQYMIGRAHELLADHADDSISASIAKFADDEPMFAPGSDFSYSGPGFMVAAAVVEQVTGQRWADVLRERVLRPAGMDRTFTTADEAITHRVAAPHDITDGRARVARDEGWQLHWQLPGWDVPGGGVLSTPNELLRYADFAERAAPGTGHFRTLANRGVPGQDIAYGWMAEHRRGRAAYLHDGLTIGYSTRLVLVPEARLGYAILTNSVKGEPFKNAVERRILDACFGAEPRVDAPVEPVDAYLGLVGRYDCGFYGQADLRVRADGAGFELVSLPTARDDGSYTIDPMSVARLLPAGPGVLSSDPGSEFPEEIVAYVRDDAGRGVALRLGERLAVRVGG
ncbi:serine hydrolase domain-containing protein [Agromyces mediolanus]|uniref:serine hydrolase domain-containing protein n=1 Tax=Agromyces mediolanus TaxID=41986 RepID=UPI00383481BF